MEIFNGLHSPSIFGMARLDAKLALRPFPDEGFDKDSVRVKTCRVLDFQKDAPITEILDFIYAPDSEYPDIYRVYYRYIKTNSDTEFLRSLTFYVREKDIPFTDPVDIARYIEGQCYNAIASHESERPLE